MPDNLQKHLPFIVHIPVSKENVKVFCNILLFVFLYLCHEVLLTFVKENIVGNVKGEYIVHFINLLTLFLKNQIWQFTTFRLEKHSSL